MGDNSYLRDGNVFIEAQHIGAAAPILSAADLYVAGIDTNGNITSIDFDGRDIGDDEEIARALAPYVRDGSYMELCDDMGYLWRWVFDGEGCTSVDAIVLWPKPDAPKDIKQQIQKVFEQHLMPEQ